MNKKECVRALEKLYNDAMILADLTIVFNDVEFTGNEDLSNKAYKTLVELINKHFDGKETNFLIKKK